MVDIALVETSSADGEELSASAVSWGSIIAGGVIASAVAFLLFILGAGLGLSTTTMLTTQTATALGVGTVIWLVVTQWVSGGIGGYITGRLRTKWVRVHSNEVFFRDTAHGFAAWALGVVVSMSILALGAAAVIGGAGSAATSVASSAVQGGAQAAGQALSSPTTGYYLDTLFRPAAPVAGATAASGPTATTAAPAATPAPETPAPSAAAAGGRSMGDIRAEAGRILIRSMGSADPMVAADKTYLAQLIAARAGISQADAEKRIDDVTAQAKAAADKARQVADDARKATAALALFTFVSLLIGAFVSSAAAAFGGNQRDENETLYRTTTMRS